MVTAGVKIHDCSIIAAGSVVTKDVKELTMVAGVPARVIKEYDSERKCWVRVAG